jgi:hypothetical protein
METTVYDDILIPNGYVSIPDSHSAPVVGIVADANVATVLSNLAYYGYTVDRAAFTTLLALDFDGLAEWWVGLKPVLSTLTGEDRNMGDHIVYRNFPKEVLDMDVTDQVFRQIMFYLGVPYDLLREDEVPRPVLGEISKLKVLKRADHTTLRSIYADLVKMSNRWNNNQTEWAKRLVAIQIKHYDSSIDVDAYGFKENAIAMIVANPTIETVKITTATDVLRLASAMSEQDVSLRGKIVLRAFKRPERRRLLGYLDACANILDDVAMRPELFKRLFERLRPGDYKFENVKKAYDALYNKRVKSFNSLIDPQNPTLDVLEAAQTRPGVFLRNFHHYYDLFGREAVTRFIPLLEKLTTRQLVSLRAYMATINRRETLIYAPNANWGRAKVEANTKSKLPPEAIVPLDATISDILKARLAVRFPEGITLSNDTTKIKLQTNDQKLADYGRGTVFDIPDNIKFVRSASYWQNPKQGRHYGNTWFDNGWNFFNDKWMDAGVCSWSQQNADGAIMSGDPTNSKDMLGRGCQLIDLYLDQLKAKGVRYCVWNILCFSNVKFSEADEVLATLQWGEDAEAGKVYEPSRAQMVFPLKGEQLSSYVAYIDLVERKLVYMDAPLPANVSHAESNSVTLERLMPAYVEYLDALPTVHDLLRDAAGGTLPVVYSDVDMGAEHERAYVFRRENTDHAGTLLTISDFLEA